MFDFKPCQIKITPKTEYKAVYVGAINKTVGEIVGGSFVSLSFDPPQNNLRIKQQGSKNNCTISFDDIISFEVSEYAELPAKAPDVAEKMKNKEYFGRTVMDDLQLPNRKKIFTWYAVLRYYENGREDCLVIKEFLSSAAVKSHSATVFETIILQKTACRKSNES